LPAIKRIGRYRFFFYSRESNEPPHIHVQSAERAAKFWLIPVALARSDGYNSAELTRLQELVEENRQLFLEAWNGYFGA
jgi:Domain of unknown function (DUF4160)